MAETWTNAFGRYLRTLRERCNLSLHDVSSLSQTFADTLNKGYLSRCENGHQRLAFSKVIPLSRIYDIPSDVLLERMDLDMELDRVGGPDTEGMDFETLVVSGKKAVDKGYKWLGYGYCRDAAKQALVDPVGPQFRDRSEQIACGHLNCATTALGLGRLKFALYEYRHVETSTALPKRLLPILLERLSCTNMHLEKLDEARGYAERAIVAAEEPDRKFLGYAYASRAQLALVESDLEQASTFYQKAHGVFREEGRFYEAASQLCNLAQVYFDLGRYRAARRALAACEKTLKPHEHNRTRAFVRILLGEIEALENNDSAAEGRWKEAVSIAKRLNDKVLRFKAEYQLLKQACHQGNRPVARALHRRLSRLSNYVPKDTPELRDYERLAADNSLTP